MTITIFTPLIGSPVFILGICLWIRKDRKPDASDKAARATLQDAEIAREMTVWRCRHGNDDQSHPEFQSLVRARLGTFWQYWITHPDMVKLEEAKEQLQYLQSLLVSETK